MGTQRTLHFFNLILNPLTSKYVVNASVLRSPETVENTFYVFFYCSILKKNWSLLNVLYLVVCHCEFVCISQYIWMSVITVDAFICHCFWVLGISLWVFNHNWALMMSAPWKQGFLFSSRARTLTWTIRIDPSPSVAPHPNLFSTLGFLLYLVTLYSILKTQLKWEPFLFHHFSYCSPPCSSVSPPYHLSPYSVITDGPTSVDPHSIR